MQQTHRYCLYCLERKPEQVICPVCSMDDRQIAVTAHALTPGTLLCGRYLLGRVLGSGGFAITYLALDQHLNIKMAIKEYLPSMLAGRSVTESEVRPYTGVQGEQFSQGLQSFLDEAQTLVRFNHHPGIVSIRDFFHQNGTAYIVMDYLDGITLKEYLENRGERLTVDETLQIILPVMDALREVHEIGLLHRDVSPDNIYITKNRQVKLLDFGAARYAIGEASQSLSVILKPGYAPHEQYISDGKQGPWTDIYATAATIYRMLSGQRPLESISRMADDQLKPLGECGVQADVLLETVLYKALSIRPAGRFQTMNDFQQALQSVTAASTSPEVQQPSGRNKRFIWLSVLGLFALISAVVFIMMFSAPDEEVPMDTEKAEDSLSAPAKSLPEVTGEPEVTAKPEVTAEPELNSGKQESDIQLGEYVQFGSYYGAPIIWRVIHLDEKGDPMLWSDKLLTFKAFDAGNSSRYIDSTLRKWLNSREDRVSWTALDWADLNEYYVYNSYEYESGFLSNANFTAQERASIKPHTHQVEIADYQTGPVMVTDDVFILSEKQFREYVYNRSDLFGTEFHKAQPTAQALKNSEYKGWLENQKWLYWLNTPYKKSEYQLRNVNAGGNINFSLGAYPGYYGVRPALVLDLKNTYFESGGAGTETDAHVIQKRYNMNNL